MIRRIDREPEERVPEAQPRIHPARPAIGALEHAVGIGFHRGVHRGRRRGIDGQRRDPSGVRGLPAKSGDGPARGAVGGLVDPVRGAGVDRARARGIDGEGEHGRVGNTRPCLVPGRAPVGALEDDGRRRLARLRPRIDGRRSRGVDRQGERQQVRQARVDGCPASPAVSGLVDARPGDHGVEGARARRVDGEGPGGRRVR